MRNYLNSQEKNDVLIIGAFMTWLDDFVKDTGKHERSEVIKTEAEKIIEGMDKLLKAMLIPCEWKQRKQLERMNSSSSVVVVSKADARSKERVVEVAQEDMNIIAGCAVDAQCRMCTKTKSQMRACRLRYAFLRTGSIEPPEGFATGDCEYSRL